MRVKHAQPFLHGPPAIWRPHAWCQEYEAEEAALSARLAAAEDAEGAAAARLEAAEARREGARTELGAAQQRAAEVAQRRATCAREQGAGAWLHARQRAEQLSR